MQKFIRIAGMVHLILFASWIITAVVFIFLADPRYDLIEFVLAFAITHVGGWLVSFLAWLLIK